MSQMPIGRWTLHAVALLSFVSFGLARCAPDAGSHVSSPGRTTSAMGFDPTDPGDPGGGGGGSPITTGDGIANGLPPGSAETDDGCDLLTPGEDQGVDEYGELIRDTRGLPFDDGRRGATLNGFFKLSDGVGTLCQGCPVLPRGRSRSGLAENGFT